MSDDVENAERPDPKKNGKPAGEAEFEREQRKGPVDPANEDLFEFLDNLFAEEGEFPERIDVCTVKGRNCDVIGLRLTGKVFNGSAKPSREKIVALSNLFLHRMRLHTDQHPKGRECHFIVGAINHQRSDDYYDSIKLTLRATGKYRNASGIPGLDGGGSGEDDDFANHYNIKQLDHQEHMFSLMGGFIEGLIDRSDRQAQAAMMENERLRSKNIELLDVAARAIMAEEERADQREERKFWREQKGKIFEIGYSLLPPVISALGQKQLGSANWQPGTESSEAYTLREFCKTQEEGGKLSKEQLEKVFGTVVDNKLQPGGVLTPEQGHLIVGVAQKQIPPEMLYDLLPDGKAEIKQEQFTALLGLQLPPEALFPIKMLFDVLNAKRQEKPQGEKK